MPNRENLKRLADYLAKLPADYQDFDMNIYARDSDGESLRPHEITSSCGTVACAAGHGPAAGIGLAKKYRSWGAYIDDNFAIDSKTWEYLFSGAWTSVDNTPHGAAARIYRYLDHGVPDSICRFKKDSYASYLEDIENEQNAQRKPEQVS